MKKQIKESSISEQIRGLAVLVEQTNDGVKLIAEQHGNLVDKIDGLDKRMDGFDKKMDSVMEQVAQVSVDMTLVKEDTSTIKKDLKRKVDIASLA